MMVRSRPAPIRDRIHRCKTAECPLDENLLQRTAGPYIGSEAAINRASFVATANLSGHCDAWAPPFSRPYQESAFDFDPESLITASHLAISDLMKLASSSGVDGATITPMASSFALTAGSPSAPTVSRLILFTISGGTFAGTTS